MLLVAIESSGLVASVALMTEDKLIGEYTTNFKRLIPRHFCRC